MPTYEYECQSCGHTFERFQSMTDEPVKRCPVCRCKVRRLIGTGAGIIFKGSGFYETDYRSSSYQQAAKKESEASSSGSTKSESADSKSSSSSSSSSSSGAASSDKSASSGKSK